MPPLIEVCVEGVDGAIVAAEGGADRIELCASLAEGGITPSLGVVREAMRRTSVPLHVMVRPRGGDFLYSPAEFASMLADVAMLRDEGVAGVVVGCLLADGTVDEARTRALAEQARPVTVAFHRAFDMTRDPAEALETLIRCGVHRVLTSGQRPTAIDGLATLRALTAQAAGRIVVLGCGALDAATIGHVRREANLDELHFSAGIDRASGMAFRNPLVFMGAAPPEREYVATSTDPERVRAMIAAAREG